MIRRLFALLRHLIDAVVWGSLLAALARIKLPRAAAPEPKRTWRRRLIEAGALFAVLGVFGALVMVSGIVPIKASSGHWAITRWILEFSMARSISTHSLGIETPKLDDPALVVKGAGQYETACRPCHGSPELRHPRVAAAMLPQPPYLPPKIPEWSPRELFTIVKHGVKLTGMPAWPAKDRDDEVWAMVAFLRVLPRLDAAEYRRLAFGETEPSAAAAPIEDLTGPENVPPRMVIERCARCHGVDGNGRGLGAFPKLAGQHPAYLYGALRAYEAGRRPSGIMEPVAAGLSEDEIRELAAYYGRLEPRRLSVASHSGAAIARGREIAERGIPTRRVPACADCHGPATPSPRGEYPRLAGQYADYLVLQLELFAKGHRGGTPWSRLMHEVAPKLERQEMRDVAAYYESLAP
jgi:cytochrome c553